MLKGVIPMLPTPFDVNKDIIFGDLSSLIENQIEMGAHGISILGLGGESGLLTYNERTAVTEYTIKEVAGRLPIIVGVSAETTEDSCNLANHAASNGVTAIMLAPRPIKTQTQDDLFEYFTKVSKAASGIEVMLQDAPEYLGIDLNNELIKRLSDEIKNIAKSFKNKSFNIRDLKKMDDDLAIDYITSLKGLGVWSAQMFLMFNLNRPDIFPTKDIGLIRAISKNYKTSYPPSKRFLNRISKIHSGYRSVFTWYMWRSIDPVDVEY
mgnify:CR=1 FL=1